MERVFRIARGGKIFAGVAGSLMIAMSIIGIFLPLIPDAQGRQDLGYFYVAGPFILMFAAFIALAMYNTIRGRIIIDDDKIYTTGIIPARSLHFDQIRGFTRDPNGSLSIMPHKGAGKSIKISAFTEGQGRISTWLQAHFLDLDKAGRQERISEALGDARLGETEIYRVERLKREKRLLWTLNGTGVLAALWLLLLPIPYGLAAAVCIALPLIVIAVGKTAGGRVNIRTENDKAVFPDITIALGAPAAALLLRALLDYHIYAFKPLLLPFALVTTVLLTITLRGTRSANANPRRQVMIISTLALICLGYSFGALIMINCYLDRSATQVFQATITRRRIQSDEGRKSYILQLSPWGSEDKEREIMVRWPLYSRAAVGQSIIVQFRQGRLHVPWFVVKLPADTSAMEAIYRP